MSGLPPPPPPLPPTIGQTFNQNNNDHMANNKSQLLMDIQKGFKLKNVSTLQHNRINGQNLVSILNIQFFFSAFYAVGEHKRICIFMDFIVEVTHNFFPSNSYV